jgi:hypothetical protein
MHRSISELTSRTFAALLSRIRPKPIVVEEGKTFAAEEEI